MTDAPAYTVHDGNGVPATWRREEIANWLTKNGINPAHVSPDEPVTVLTIPHWVAVHGEAPRQLQVIVLTEYYINADGKKEQNFLTRKPATVQRTVPLQVPFPAPVTADEGTRNGQADQQAAQEAPEVQVRPSWSAPVSDRHEGEGSQRPGSGSAERIEGDPEDHPSQGHEAVPELEEDRREEVGRPQEVGGDR